MDKLLTKKQLAERWQVTEKAIDNWRKEGILTPCKGIPAIRFSLQHIAELEGTKLEKFSPLERRKLERELDEWKARAEKAESVLARANVIIAEAIYLKAKEA